MGELIRELRETAGLSQRQLADRIGVRSNTIANLERGYVITTGKPIKPHRATLTKVADGLGIDEQRMYDAYGTEQQGRHARFDITGLTAVQVERVRGYIDGLRDQ